MKTPIISLFLFLLIGSHIPLSGQLFTFEFVQYERWMTEDFGANSIEHSPHAEMGLVTLTEGNEAKFQEKTPNMILKSLYNTFNHTSDYWPTSFKEAVMIAEGYVDIELVLVLDSPGVPEDADSEFDVIRVDESLQDHPYRVLPQVEIGPYDEAGMGHTLRITLGEYLLRKQSSITFHNHGSNTTYEISQDDRYPEGLLAMLAVKGMFVGPWNRLGTYSQFNPSVSFTDELGRFREELWLSQGYALIEGLARSYGAVSSMLMEEQIRNFWEDPTPRYYLPASSGLWKTKALSQTRTYEGKYHGEDIQLVKWIDMPGYSLLFSESTAAMFYSQLREQHDDGYQTLMLENIITPAVSLMHQAPNQRYLTYQVAAVAHEMERFAATKKGRQMASEQGLISSMFAFALLDILTHFDLTEEHFTRTFLEPMPQPYPKALRAYFDRHREKVKEMVRFNQIPAIGLEVVDDAGDELIKSAPYLNVEDEIEKVATYFKKPSLVLKQ